MIGASFDSTKTPQQDLFAWADSGKFQLPDFQRGWVWQEICPRPGSASSVRRSLAPSWRRELNFVSAWY
jgi:hypothetical protein